MCPKGVFLDVIRAKILRFFLHAIHSHLQQRIFLLGLVMSSATAESGGAWLCLHYLFVYL
jgi:hypothetical protein